MKKVITLETRKPAVTEELPESAGEKVRSLSEVDQEHVAWVQIVQALRFTEQLSRLAHALADGSQQA
jgi:hypothetical protein